MPTTPEQAEQLIAQGEGLTVEFKRELSAKDAVGICKEVAAFATSNGGHILLGVGDNKDIYGLPDAKIISEKIDNWITTHIDPKPVVDSNILSISGKDVLIIQVANGTALYYMYKDIPYNRVGSKSHPMTPGDIEYIKQNSHTAKLIVSLKDETELVKSIAAEAQAMAAKAQSMVAAVQDPIASAFIGQGELATKNYKEVKNAIINEFIASAEFQNLKLDLAICKSTAAVAFSQGTMLESKLDALNVQLNNLASALNQTSTHDIHLIRNDLTGN